ncbi:MAG: Si-specific NAD(P)(+) transhydrogenase [Trueperaceae bacterium]|nr:Si-specific NAD(P)(+) transhydrogenase [Trueperaceae bacterium]
MPKKKTKANYDYDVIVIGTGPGGEGAAMQAVKSGKHVAVIERYKQIGGGCTHWGTIPSKALRHAIYQMTNTRRTMLENNIQLEFEYPKLLAQANDVIAQQVNMRYGFYDRNDVEIIRGHAHFTDEHQIQVDDAESYSAEHFVIATGSRPWHPDDVDFNHPRIFDSDTILNLSYTPHSITIYGAGVIGCEYASMFRNMGLKVNLINTRDKLLSFLDDEIIDALSYHLRDQGCLIRHNEVYESIHGEGDGVVLALQSGKKVKSDILLWANGRTGNTDDLGLGTIKLEPDSRGQLSVNENFQTALPHIYAVGDVIGFPALASAAYTQGRDAVRHLLGLAENVNRPSDIPTGIYTSPEISSIGKTEKELTEEKVPYEVGHSHFKSLARAQIMGQPVGQLKILFHRETLEILGIHCFGVNAAEIIHIGQAIMAQKDGANTLEYFLNTTFNYPTMAEAYRVAALNGYNRIF